VDELVSIRSELSRHRRNRNLPQCKFYLFKLLSLEQATFTEEQELYRILQEEYSYADRLNGPKVTAEQTINLFNGMSMTKVGVDMRLYLIKLVIEVQKNIKKNPKEAVNCLASLKRLLEDKQVKI